MVVWGLAPRKISSIRPSGIEYESDFSSFSQEKILHSHPCILYNSHCRAFPIVGIFSVANWVYASFHPEN